MKPTAMNKLIALLTAAAAVGGSSECRALDDSEGAARIGELVPQYQRLGYLNGTVLVALGGKVIYAQGIGEADMESHIPNTPRTRFGIASITKQFTAALVLQQAALGKLRLQDTVADYLPWYRKDTGQRMSIEQLLHHTSVLPADFDSPAFGDGPEAGRRTEPEEFAQRYCQPDLVSEPGQKWAYSNSGDILLGLVLERASGKAFADLLREQILDPLGMKDTGMDNNDLVEKGGAVGYTRHAGPRYTPGPYEDRSHISSAGAMYSTVEDLYRWECALGSDQLFSKAIREQIFEPGLSNWGYGWFVTRIAPGWPGAGSLMAEMRGDMPGNYFAWILRYPEQRSTIIVLRNGYGSTEHLEENLQALLFDQAPRLPHRNGKDVLAKAWQTGFAGIGVRQVWAVLIALAMLLLLWRRASGRRAARVAAV